MIPPRRREGIVESLILADYSDVIIHIFSQPAQVLPTRTARKEAPVVLKL
jgi:hypothetical protein